MILLFYKSSLLTYCSKWKEKPCRKTLNHTVYLTLTSRFTSVLSSLPFPSLSYILKDHLSRSSRLPRKIKWSAATYSRKSSVLSCLKITKRYIYSEVVHWFLQRQIVPSFYLVCVERVEYCFYEKGLLYRAAWNSKDLLELMQVQGTAWTLLHKNDTQLMNPCKSISSLWLSSCPMASASLKEKTPSVFVWKFCRNDCKASACTVKLKSFGLLLSLALTNLTGRGRLVTR